MKRTIPKKLVKKTKKWLGKDGMEFFLQCWNEHGTLLAVLNDGGLPHPVHFREGMQVRNFMRSTKLCEGWDAHDYDDNWEDLVLSVIL